MADLQSSPTRNTTTINPPTPGAVLPESASLVTPERLLQFSREDLLTDRVLSQITRTVDVIIERDNDKDALLLYQALREKMLSLEGFASQHRDTYQFYVNTSALLKLVSLQSLKKKDVASLLQNHTLLAAAANIHVPTKVNRYVATLNPDERLPFRRELEQAVIKNKESLGSQPVHITGEKELLPAEVGSWILDYNKYTNYKAQRAAIDEATFLSQSRNAQSLDTIEKELLTATLRIYDGIRNPLFTEEQNKKKVPFVSPRPVAVPPKPEVEFPQLDQKFTPTVPTPTPIKTAPTPPVALTPKVHPAPGPSVPRTSSPETSLPAHQTLKEIPQHPSGGGIAHTTRNIRLGEASASRVQTPFAAKAKVDRPPTNLPTGPASLAQSASARAGRDELGGPDSLLAAQKPFKQTFASPPHVVLKDIAVAPKPSLSIKHEGIGSNLQPKPASVKPPTPTFKLPVPERPRPIVPPRSQPIIRKTAPVVAPTIPVPKPGPAVVPAAKPVTPPRRAILPQDDIITELSTVKLFYLRSNRPFEENLDQLRGRIQIAVTRQGVNPYNVRDAWRKSEVFKAYKATGKMMLSQAGAKQNFATISDLVRVNGQEPLTQVEFEAMAMFDKQIERFL